MAESWQWETRSEFDGKFNLILYSILRAYNFFIFQMKVLKDGGILTYGKSEASGCVDNMKDHF